MMLTHEQVEWVGGDRKRILVEAEVLGIHGNLTDYFCW